VLKVLTDLNKEFGDLSKSIQGTLVKVSNGRRGAAAGTVMHADGLVVTNAHVIDRGTTKVVVQEGSEFKAHVLAVDRSRDLAALSIQTDDLSPLPRGDSKNVRTGEWVVAFGHPWGVPGAATAGVIIGHGDQLPERPNFGGDWIAVSLHYRPGHSGGPLVNSKGELIAINTLMTGPDVGLAIPIHEVVFFLEENKLVA
jgi:S1-C subfamily serine protease